MNDDRETVSDLFAGPGGWDVALQALGFRVRGVAIPMDDTTTTSLERTA